MARVHFKWMEAYWSCTPDAWEAVQHAAANGNAFNLYAFGCRELKARPRGKVHVLVEADIRRTGRSQ